MRTSSSRKPAVRVKTKVHQEATKLIPVLVRRGEHEGFFHVPVCEVCHKPVLDFEAGNVVVKGWDSKPLESLGTVGDTEFLRTPGDAFVVHFECDRHEWKPWVRLSSVFHLDQRSPAEKLGAFPVVEP